MRERSIDEFEAIFQKASIPVFGVPEVKINRVSAVLKGDALDASSVSVATYLRDRFNAEGLLHWTERAERRVAAELAAAHQLQLCPEPFQSTDDLAEQVEQADPQMLLLPEPEDLDFRVVRLDDLVEKVTAPVLILRTVIDQPAEMFRRVLRCLTGNFQTTRNFAYAFKLTEPDGVLELLHTVADTEIADVKDALELAPEVSDKEGDELLAELAHHGERYLKGVALAGKKQPFEITYRVSVGDVLDVARAEIEKKDHGLLIVGRHFDGRSHVQADVYQLMHAIRSVPVLAL